MTVGVSRNIIKPFICLLILISFSTATFAFQEKTITVNENIYKRVIDGAKKGTDFVILDNITDFGKFKIRDTVLLIQMKGAQSRVVESGFYGELQDTTGSPGRYEFLIIEDTFIAQKKIVFTNPIVNSYDFNSDVQLIRVPSYYSVKVAADLVCPPWDSISKTGGVLAMIAGGTLKLNSNINVSSKGFIGGLNIKGIGACTQLDPATLRNFAYDTSFKNSGFKGEGIVSKGWFDFTTQIPIYPAYSKGKGASFNGGGGGNGRFSGGAGGSHIGTGGKGGKEFYDICTESDANNGGKTVDGTIIEGGLFLGGGGGGSTYSGTGVGVNGGRGGGVIIILANEIDGNGYTISADGEFPAGVATGTAGAGGGGGGGSIALYVERFSPTILRLSAKGGQGGSSNSNDSGEGGGGGGGLIWTNIATPANVTPYVIVSGGPKGTTLGTQTSVAGNPGKKSTALLYIPQLNGFLFNSIRSSKTNNLIDSVCSNNIPYPILGTTPLGGSGTYTFLWQRKNDSGGVPSGIASSNVKDFTFSASEADTFFVRRIVKDDVTALTDTSKWLKIIVQPKILNNTVNIQSSIVSLSDTICWNGDPKLIDQALPDLIIPSSRQPKYTWQDSSLISTWGAILGTGKSYDPPAGLQQLGNKYFRRKVTYGRCGDSTAIVRFHVLDTIKKNLIATRFDTICHGGTFVDLNGDPALSGGDNTFRYLWQYSQTGASGSWSTATGVATGATYNPDEASPLYPGKLYYRRKVFSGAHNVCADSSKSAVRQDWPVITANNIAADETVCSGLPVGSVTGAEPLNGAGPGTFKYTWQDSSKFHNWTSISGYIKVPGLGYAPSPLTDTTAFRRIAYSSKCSDISKRVVKRVHKPVTNFNVALFSGTWDTILCSEATPKKLNGLTPGAGSGTGNPANNIYQWSSSATKVGGYSDISGAIAEDFQPATLTNASPTIPSYFYYRRKVTNGACTVTSDSAVKITVLPRISNNVITADPATCYNIAPNPLTGPPLTGGDGTPKWKWQQSINTGATWSDIPGATSQTYAATPLTVPTQYKRIVFSGLLDCCRDTSNVKSIAINPLPAGNITGAVDTICEGTPGKVFNIQITGSTASPWTVVYNENSTNKSTSVSAATSTVPLSPVIPGASTDSASFTYRLVSIKDANNCNAVTAGLTGARKLVVWKVPVVDAGPAADNCGPVYRLTGTKNVGTGNWTYPGVPVLNSSATGNNLTVTVDLPYVPAWFHKYRFYFNVKNWTCYSKDSVDITFYLKPDSAKAGNDTTIYSLDKEVVLPYITPAIGTGAWTMITGGASQKDDSTFTNLVIGDNEFEWRITNKIAACFSADLVTYTINNLVIPDAFSPNNDGINDEFEILGLDLVNSNVTLTILNSAGSEIYRTTNVGGTYIPWNGETKGDQVPEGTYYYLLVIESTKKGNNTVQKPSGFIIVKRY